MSHQLPYGSTQVYVKRCGITLGFYDESSSRFLGYYVRASLPSRVSFDDLVSSTLRKAIIF